MSERLVFVPSEFVKDPNDLKEIEFWGHDAGEYFYELIEEVLKESVESKETKVSE